MYLKKIHRRLCFAARVSAMLSAVFVATAVMAGGGNPAGELLSRGSGVTADAHDLPARAIDTKHLPHTRLSARDGRDAPLPVYRLAPDTYMLYGNVATINDDNRGFNANAGFVVTADGVVVIDALGTPKLGERFIAAIREVTGRPIRYLILTHNHPDHAYGAAAFARLPDIEIVAHPDIAGYLGSEVMQRSVDYRRDLLPGDMQNFSFPQPDLYVPEQRFDRRRIELGGKIFDVYNAGGHHSHGDLLVHQVQANILWVSDLVFNQRVTYLGDGDSQQVLEAQAWMLETFPDVRLMVPGHGSAQTAPFPMVARTRDYVETLRTLMRRQLEAGAGLLDATEQADMPAWRAEPLYEENQRANAEFVYRELEFDSF